MTVAIQSGVEFRQRLAKVRVLASIISVASLALCNVDYVFVLARESPVKL